MEEIMSLFNDELVSNDEIVSSFIESTFGIETDKYQ